MAAAGLSTATAPSFSERVNQEYALKGHSGTWAELIRLSRAPGVLDLGQGWPDFGASETARDTASKAIMSETDVRINQYSPPNGLAILTTALSQYYKRTTGWELDPEKDVLVTSSATEALYVAAQAFVNPGDEVIVFEPIFPWYVTNIRLAGGVPVPVRLEAPSFGIDEGKLQAAFTSKTKMVIFNTPHNPTGHVLSRPEAEMLARLCVQHNVVVISDEVYERKVFGGREEIRLADLPGMWERTVTLGTASKLFSLTGWRVGWALGPGALVEGLRLLHSYCTYNAPTPLQAGVAAALDAETAGGHGPDAMSHAMEANFVTLRDALQDVGLQVFPAEGGYFAVADVAATGLDASTYCRRLIQEAKVAAVPMDIFYVATDPPPPATMVRFALCKRPETIAAAAAAIRAHPVRACGARSRRGGR